jgi:beta-lactamase superfamily II metal-dependent hydrolase
LDRLLGGKKAEGTESRTAFVSAARNGAPKHPAKKVTNAFRRRGAPVHATQGMHKRYHKNGPDRGWTASVALPLFTEVDD